MSENLPVMVIVTSADCSACKYLHSSGDFNRDGPVNEKANFVGIQWNALTFWKLLTGTTEPNSESKVKFKVYEVETYHLRKQGYEGIKSMTEFVLENKQGEILVNRNTYYRSAEGEDHTVYVKNEATFDNGEKRDKSFTGLVSATIPAGMNSLIGQYPSFLWFGRDQWNKALSNKNYVPYGIIFSWVMGERDGPSGKEWGIVAKETDEKKSTPYGVMKYIVGNPNALTPPTAIEQKPAQPTAKAKPSTAPTRRSTGPCTAPLIKIVPLSNNNSFYSRGF